MSGVLNAASIDPAPITAWLVLVLTAIGVVGAVVGCIAWLWKYVAMPQLVALVDASGDQLKAEGAAELRALHDRIDHHLQNHPA